MKLLNPGPHYLGGTMYLSSFPIAWTPFLVEKKHPLSRKWITIISEMDNHWLKSHFSAFLPGIGVRAMWRGGGGGQFPLELFK